MIYTQHAFSEQTAHALRYAVLIDLRAGREHDDDARYQVC